MTELEPQQRNQPARRRWPAMLFFGVFLLGSIWFSRFKAPHTVDVAALTLTSPDGRPLPKTLYEDKAVILNLWAPWCGPCNSEAPWLQAVQQKFAGRLLVVGVDTDSDTYSQIPEFASRTGAMYPLVATNTHIHDQIGTVAGVPTTFYIDRRGKVLHTVTGAIPQAVMEKYAKDIIKQ